MQDERLQIVRAIKESAAKHDPDIGMQCCDANCVETRIVHTCCMVAMQGCTGRYLRLLQPTYWSWRCQSSARSRLS